MVTDQDTEKMRLNRRTQLGRYLSAASRRALQVSWSFRYLVFYAIFYVRSPSAVFHVNYTLCQHLMQCLPGPRPYYCRTQTQLS